MIVTSQRRDGKVTQRQVAYLGSVHSAQCHDVAERQRLWDALPAVLDRLQLSTAQGKAIGRALHRVAPHPKLEPVVTPEVASSNRAQIA